MTEDNIVWWVASLIVGAGAIPAGYLVVFAIDRVQRYRRPADGPTRLSIEHAFAASDLMPLISGLAKSGIPLDGSELRIFGSDGRYVVNSKSKKWRREMNAWARQGLTIRYLLLDADEEVSRRMTELKEEMGGRFDALTLDEGAIPDVARELETCHPTLFLGGDGRNAAWIEGFHPRNSIHAYDVEYISPRAMQHSRGAKDTFEHYASKLEAVRENSRSLVARQAVP